MPPEKSLLRPALSPGVLLNATLAAAGEAKAVRFRRATFRETVDLAAKTFLAQIETNLDQAGFASQLKWGYPESGRPGKTRWPRFGPLQTDAG